MPNTLTIEELHDALQPFLRTHSQKEQARLVIDGLRTALSTHPTPDIMTPTTVYNERDGSVSLGWYYPDRRLAIIFEDNPKDSSWHAIEHPVGRDMTIDSGSLEQANWSKMIGFIYMGGWEP